MCTKMANIILLLLLATAGNHLVLGKAVNARVNPEDPAWLARGLRQRQATSTTSLTSTTSEATTPSTTTSTTGNPPVQTSNTSRSTGTTTTQSLSTSRSVDMFTTSLPSTIITPTEAIPSDVPETTSSDSSINTSLRSTMTRSTTTDTPTGAPNSVPSFMNNKTAMAATFTAVGLALVSMLTIAFFYFRRRMRNGSQEEWEAESMAEYAGPKAFMSSPDLGAAGGASNGNQNDVDDMLALPPVNIDRPRDSAYDIVPPLPPNSTPFSNIYARRPYDPSTPQVPLAGHHPNTFGTFDSNGYDAVGAYAIAPYQPVNPRTYPSSTPQA